MSANETITKKKEEEDKEKKTIKNRDKGSAKWNREK